MEVKRPTRLRELSPRFLLFTLIVKLVFIPLSQRCSATDLLHDRQTPHPWRSHPQDLIRYAKRTVPSCHECLRREFEIDISFAGMRSLG